MDVPDLRVARLAERQHSVFSRAQALACGLSGAQIDGRLERGLWLRLHRSVYRMRGAPSTFEGEVFGAVLASGPSACASHKSAGALWKLEGIVGDAIEISVRNRRRTRVPGVVIHLPRTLRPKDITRIGVIPITTLARTLLDLAAAIDVPALEDALDDATRRELVTPKAMLSRLRATEANGRRGLASLERLVRERLGKPTSGSGLENRARRLFRDAGLPPPIAQHVIRAPDGSFVARVDFAYPHVRLAIEIDGYERHSSRSRWESDRNRQNRLVAQGWYPLRITSRQVRHQPDDVVALVWRRLTTLERAERHQRRST